MGKHRGKYLRQIRCSKGQVGLGKKKVGLGVVFQEKDMVWLEIPKELNSKEDSDRLVKRRKAFFFYRSIYLLWHEVRGGRILIFVHKLDVFFVT